MSRLLLTVFLSVIFLASCKQQGQQTIPEKQTHLTSDSGLVYSNENNLSSDYEIGLKIYKKDGRVFLIDDLMPNSNGWTVRFCLVMIDSLTEESSEIGQFAAIHFEEDEFKVAVARLVNPDAQCTADEEWVMHDEYYNYDGVLLRKDPREYHYGEIQKIYGDSLVNASIFR